MAIYKDRHYTGFVQIHNSFCRRTDLSALAKVIMINLLSHPCDWEFTPESVTRECKESITAVRRALNELIKAGHVERIRKRTASGQFDYEFNAYETPRVKSENPTASEPEEKEPPVKKDPVQPPYSDSPLTENPQPVIEPPIPIYNKKRNTKKVLRKESEKVASIEQKFGKYKNVSLTPEEYNKLIELYGKDQTDRSIEVASEYGHSHKRQPYGYARIEKWIREDIEKAQAYGQSKDSHRKSDFDINKYKIFVNDFEYDPDDMYNVCINNYATIDDPVPRYEEELRKKEEERQKAAERKQAEYDRHFAEMTAHILKHYSEPACTV